jgi:hypothetical protein
LKRRPPMGLFLFHATFSIFDRKKSVGFPLEAGWTAYLPAESACAAVQKQTKTEFRNFAAPFSFPCPSAPSCDVDRGWSMKLSSLLAIFTLFALAVALGVRANDQQTQQAALNAAVCLLAIRAGSSSDRRSDLQAQDKSLVIRRSSALSCRADRTDSLRDRWCPSLS